MIRISAFLLLILSAVAMGRNYFVGDTHAVALWDFENGANIGEDTLGGNDLAVHGTVARTAFAGSPVHYPPMAGLYDANFVYPTQPYLYRADADLDAGFPLKSGDTNKKISICFWFFHETCTVGDQCLLGKWDKTGNKRSLAIYRVNANAPRYIALEIGYNGGSSADVLTHTGLDITNSHWIHIGVTYDDSDRSYRIRVYDLVTDTVTETAGTAPHNINVEDAAWMIGFATGDAVYGYGWYDEGVIFKRVLTPPEIDKIRKGIYGSGAKIMRLTEY